MYSGRNILNCANSNNTMQGVHTKKNVKIIKQQLTNTRTCDGFVSVLRPILVLVNVLCEENLHVLTVILVTTGSLCDKISLLYSVFKRFSSFDIFMNIMPQKTTKHKVGTTQARKRRSKTLRELSLTFLQLTMHVVFFNVSSLRNKRQSSEEATIHP